MDSSSPENNNRPNPKFDNFGIAGKSLIPRAEAQGTVYESFQAANQTPEPTKKADIKDDIAALHKEESVIPNLRTYESDVADAMKKKQTSVVHIAVEEHKKAIAKPAAAKKSTGTSPVINLIIIVLSLFLVGGGLGAMALLIYYKITTPSAVTVVPDKPKIITTESSVNLIIPPGESPAKTIRVQKPVLGSMTGSLTQINFYDGTTTKGEPMSAEDFINRLSATVPTWLSASFNKQFVFGYQRLDTPQPFVIFKTNSYDNAFAGMLKWESTLPADFLTLNVFNTQASTTASTTVPQAHAALFPAAFQDTVINNKDVRILFNDNGEPILMYSVPDKQTIIITTNIGTLKELFSRLATSRFVQ